VEFFDSTGRQQLFHVFDPERFGQRRGIGLLASSADQLKQLSRAADAELMSVLLASYFTVFVKDASGYGSLLGPALTPEETVTGGGRYGPDEAEATEQYDADGNDLEMGAGNITYLDDQKDISIANPIKSDREFPDFWDALSKTASAASNMPIEQALMHYQTSYTAAKAAKTDGWKGTKYYRALIVRKLLKPIFQEFLFEAVLKGRLNLPGYLEDYATRQAWSRCYWVGSGQGSINPLQETKASIMRINGRLSNHSTEFQNDEGGRWDTAMRAMSKEQELLDELGLKAEETEEGISRVDEPNADV
jgi:capsid protein